MRRRLDMSAHHHRVARALGSGGPAVPESLIRGLRTLEPAPVLTRRRRLPIRRPAFAGAVAVAMAIALAVALSVSWTGGPTVVEAAQLSSRAAERPPPPVDHARPRMLAHAFAGVRYPDWTGEFGWRAEGARDDVLDGRRTATVFYRHTHHRIGYTVVAGGTLEAPRDAERLVANGVVLHRFQRGDEDVVTFERNGRTCVLSGKVHDPDTLVKLASWKAAGEPME